MSSCIWSINCWFSSRTARSQRQIVPLDKWEILPEQIEYEEELGRGAFGVVHKATLRRRAGIEVFETGKRPRKEPKRASKMVAVKVLQGNLESICVLAASLRFNIEPLSDDRFNERLIAKMLMLLRLKKAKHSSLSKLAQIVIKGVLIVMLCCD